MTVKLETKLRWFDQGAAALSQAWPDLVQAAQAPIYICPQCFNETDLGTNKVFFREAVETKDLTAEHVPPKSFGGKELVLTCAPCNHTAGSRIESHGRKRENLAALGGRGEQKPTRVRLKGGDHIVSATLRLDEKMVELKLPPEEKHANDPRAVDGIRDFLRSEAVQELGFEIVFQGESHKAQPARVTWLRAGYLAMFAVAGYHYIFSPGLGIVRKQIQEPEAEHIPTFLAVIPGDHPWTERRIMRIREPESQRSWAVQIGRNVVFLPLPGDTTLYQRLAEESQNSDGQARGTGNQSVEWPTWPSFGIEGSEG